MLRNTIAPHMRSLPGALSGSYLLTACGNSSTKTLAKPARPPVTELCQSFKYAWCHMTFQLFLVFSLCHDFQLH